MESVAFRRVNRGAARPTPPTQLGPWIEACFASGKLLGTAPRRNNMKTRFAWWAVLGGIQLFLFPPVTRGALFNIANGDVTALKAAIVTANSNGEDDIIALANGGLYTLTTAASGANGL